MRLDSRWRIVALIGVLAGPCSARAQITPEQQCPGGHLEEYTCSSPEVQRNGDHLENLTPYDVVDFCSPDSKETQCKEIELKRFFLGSKCGFCQQCFYEDIIDNETWVEVMPTKQVEPFKQEMRRLGKLGRISCSVVPEAKCMSREPPISVSPQCSFDRTQANHQLDPEWTPPPAPGPNGELRCNNDCRSPHNWVECVDGFRICYKFSTCSDGVTVEPCTPQPCEGKIFC